MDSFPGINRFSGQTVRYEIYLKEDEKSNQNEEDFFLVHSVFSGKIIIYTRKQLVKWIHKRQLSLAKFQQYIDWAPRRFWRQLIFYISVTGILALLLLLLLVMPSRSFSNPHYVIDNQIDGSAGVCCYHTHCVLLCCFHVRIIRVWKKNRALKVKVIQRKWNIALRIVQYPILLYRFLCRFSSISYVFSLYSLNIN